MAAQIGIVKALIGTATATAADGTIRNLQIGDQVFADELITTGAGGAIELEFADGSVMDLGRNSQAVLDDTVFNPEAATAVAESTDAEVDAIQAALLAGEDPTQVGEATAAGAGVTGDGNEGHEPVVVDYLAPEAPVESGFDTTGIGVEFPEIQEELQAPDEDPVVSVSVQVEVNPENPEVEPPTDNIPTPDYPLIVTPEGVLILEGTSEVGEGEAGTRQVAFTLTLDKVYTQDVQVTYMFQPAGADNGANTYGTALEGGDWFDGTGPVTVTIPAGTQTFPVYVNIVEDNIVEDNGQFEIVLIDAVNATINPDASMVTVTIVDDDLLITDVSISTSDVTENEQGITFTATLTTPGSSDVTVSTTQGDILIAAGQTSGSIFVESYDPDIYLDPDSITAEITGVTGGEFDVVNIVVPSATADISDVIDDVTVSLSATASTSEDGGSIVYTATLTGGTANNDITVSLSNGESITILAGQASGDSAAVPVNLDDVYLETDSVSASITGVSEANAGTDGALENLTYDSTPAETTILDDSDTVTATLSTSTSEILETGGSITYVVTLTGAPGAIDPDNDLVFTLTNPDEGGQPITVTIAAGATSGQTVVNYSDAFITNQVSLDNSISAVTSGGSEYEDLQTAGSTSVDVDSIPEVGTSNSFVDETGGLDSVNGTLTADFGNDTGSVALSATGATWSAGTNTLTANDGSWKIVNNLNGTYTFTQLLAMTHAGAEDASIVLSIGVAATDTDGETTNSSFNVTVYDDGPVVTDYDGVLNNADSTLAGIIDYDLGADGLGGVVFTLDNSSVPLTSGGQAILTTSVDTDGDGLENLVGYVDLDNSGTYDAGEEVFTIAPTADDAVDGTYDITLSADNVLDLPTSTVELSFTGITAQGPIESIDVGTALTINIVDAGTVVNASNGFIGIGNNIMNDSPETIEYVFNESLVNDVQLDIKQVGASGDTISWETSGPDGTDSGTLVIGDNGLTDPITADYDFDTLTFTVTSGNFKVGGITYTDVGDPQDVLMTFGYTATGGDGDSVEGSINVTVSALTPTSLDPTGDLLQSPDSTDVS